MPARPTRALGLLFVAIAVELVVGALGISATQRWHAVPGRPVAAVVIAAYSQSPVTADTVAPAPAIPKVAPSTSESKAKAATKVAGRRPAAPRPVATPKANPSATHAAVASASGTGSGCAAAIAWLSTHSAPGYQLVCPGYAEGHQAMTCYNTAACPGKQVIVIAIPCPAAYMNEAHNSWIISGLAVGKIDPYGYC
jgi:hypothetical protein